MLLMRATNPSVSTKVKLICSQTDNKKLKQIQVKKLSACPSVLLSEASLGWS